MKRLKKCSLKIKKNRIKAIQSRVCGHIIIFDKGESKMKKMQVIDNIKCGI